MHIELPSTKKSELDTIEALLLHTWLEWTPAERAIAELRSQAIKKGYTWEACNRCGNFTLARHGGCVTCDTRRATIGCE